MEDIFQILIFVAFAAFGVIAQVRKDKKEESTASPQEVLEDMFPELEQETGMPMVEPILQQPKARKKKKTPKKEKYQPLEKPPVPSQPAKPLKQADNRKIRLTSKEEARRAFIYSEIFNRKY